MRHLVIARVGGQFSLWTGTLQMPEGDFGRASLEVVIDAASIDSGVAIEAVRQAARKVA